MAIIKPNNNTISAITALPNGIVSATALASGVGGKVLQVKSDEYPTEQSSTSTSFVDIGGLSVSITPSSTSSKIAQGEILQLQHQGEVDMLEETYLKIISAKTAELFAASTKVGAELKLFGWVNFVL